MSHTINQVLANWLHEALDATGTLEEGVHAADWVAYRFLQWLQESATRSIEDGEAAIVAVRHELLRFQQENDVQAEGALHELIHAQDAFAELRHLLQITE